VVFCIDAEETGLGWNIATSRLKTWRRRRWHKRNKDPAEVFAKFFGGDAHTNLPEGPYEITRSD
jgi:hypothetical protein